MRRNGVLAIRVERGEREVLDRAAEELGLGTSTWVRDLALTVAAQHRRLSGDRGDADDEQGLEIACE